MGFSTDSDIVPFVVHGVINLSHREDLSSIEREELQFLTSPEAWGEGEHLDDEAFNERGGEVSVEDLRGAVRCGWRLDSLVGTFGKRNLLCGEQWTVDNNCVWAINESRYSDVGEYSLTLCSNSKLSLEKFLKDWKLEGHIEEMDVVSQHY